MTTAPQEFGEWEEGDAYLVSLPSLARNWDDMPDYWAISDGEAVRIVREEIEANPTPRISWAAFLEELREKGLL